MSSNFALSFEMIYLMGWLLRHENEALSTLIQQALDNGLGKQIEQIDMAHSENADEELHAILIDFLTHTEDLLLEKIDGKHAAAVTGEDDLSPTLKKLDRSSIDTDTVVASLNDAQTEITRKRRGDATRVLFKMLLKNWQPEKTDAVN